MRQISFRLQIGQRDILLKPGETTLGRSDQCSVLLDDALLSRVHARLVVADDEVTLEDMGSKNGTYVNEKRIEVPVRLHNGDQIRLGHTRMKMTVIRRRARSSQAQVKTVGFSTQVDSAPPGIDSTDVLHRLLQVGRMEEAEKLLKSRVALLTSNADPPPVNHLMSRNVQEGLLAMAERTLGGIWLHRLFKLHAHCDWFMTADVQQKAEQLVRAVGQLGGNGLVAYVEHWSSQAELLSAPRQRQLDRLRDLANRQ